MSTTTVALVGAGHAHLHVASRARELIARGARVVLIDPGWVWYSGMATGMLGGQYDAGDDQLDPQALIEASPCSISATAPRWPAAAGCGGAAVPACGSRTASIESSCAAIVGSMRNPAVWTEQ